MTKVVIQATIDDAVPYVYTREEADEIIAGYPAHERKARAMGQPVLGSGRIYPVEDELIKWALKELPPHYVWLGGVDFGWEHPLACVKCAVDRDSDTFYVIDAWKQKKLTPVLASARMRIWGDWLPWSWPHDGLAESQKNDGEQLVTQYNEQGLYMLPDRATFDQGGNSVEAGIMELLDAMQQGRFKVASHLEDWFSEFRLYHRKNGKVVKEYDDLMDATRYAWMMRRHAVPAGGADSYYNEAPAIGDWMA